VLGLVYLVRLGVVRRDEFIFACVCVRCFFVSEK
jgi:hypothetical protein